MNDDTVQFSPPIYSVQALIDENHQLRDENHRLRQEKDILTNRLAFLEEWVQQLRDEIASLKGQEPRPKFPPGNLERKQNSNPSSNPNDPNSKKKSKTGQPKGKPRKKKKDLAGNSQ